MKTCPCCEDEIQDTAVVCPLCGNEMPATLVTEYVPLTPAATANIDAYTAALAALKQELEDDGPPDIALISIAEREGAPGLFATIRRRHPTLIADPWISSEDADADDAVYAYRRRFQGDESVKHVMDVVRAQILLSRTDD